MLTDPAAIEQKSMAIIAGLLAGLDLPAEIRPVVYRTVHASGDPDLGRMVYWHSRAVAVGVAALAAGANVVTDVRMVQAGISTRLLKGRLICALEAPGVADLARQEAITRAMAAMRLTAFLMEGAVVAVGNAPTALVELLRLCQVGLARPALIIGTPVGFVEAVESKEELVNQEAIPYLTVRGNKGGSPVAAAMVNALLHLAARED